MPISKVGAVMALLLAPALAGAQRTQAIGVASAVATYQQVNETVSAVATVASDEATQALVQVRWAGWIEQVWVDTTFQRVRQGQALCTLYSPDLYVAEQEYVFAAHNRDRLAASPVAGVARGAADLLADATARLEQLQVPGEERTRLQRTLQAQARLTITAPEDGYVTERQAYAQMRVTPGQTLYRLAGLQPIWVYAAVNESDLGRMRVGQRAQVRVDAYPGREFRGAVGFINPQVEAASRTGRVRIVLANGDGALLPGMYGEAQLAVALGRQLVVPASAVLQTGAQALAFVLGNDGQLTPRPVQLGPEVEGGQVITGGLRAGERVARAANFLIASEQQLSAAAGSFAPPPPGVGAAAAPAGRAQAVLTTAPSPARAGDNLFRVRLTDAQGRPLAGASVTLRLSMPAMPAMGMAAMQVTVALTARGGGLYEGRGRLGSGGSWQTLVVARRGGTVLVRQAGTLLAQGGK